MPILGTRRISTAAVQKAVERKKYFNRNLRVPWILFLVIGVPMGLMVILGPLAYSGLYIEPLRRLWRPWPSDVIKALIGIAAFAATLGYLTYRRGKSAGFHSGAVATTATFRNLIEGRTPLPAPVSAPPALPPAPDSLDAPLPAPEPPRSEPPRTEEPPTP